MNPPLPLSSQETIWWVPVGWDESGEPFLAVRKYTVTWSPCSALLTHVYKVTCKFKERLYILIVMVVTKTHGTLKRVNFIMQIVSQ
jgi:hypothetical protein